MTNDARATQRWHPEGRTAQTWFGLILVVWGGYQALRSVGAGASGVALLHVATVLLGLLFIVFVRSTFVEADRRGLRITRPPRRDRTIAWSDITEVRADPARTSSLEVVLRDGEVVGVRISGDSQQDLIDRWRLETR